MRPEKVFKRYDIRGRYPEELDEEFSERLGKALGTFIIQNYKHQAVVGRDNKESSKGLKKSLIDGLISTGVDVIDVGEGPTDFAAWSGMKKDCVSVEVTSSHMPLEFNGFKLMYPKGNGFVNEDLYAVQDIFREKEFVSGSGSISERPDLKDEYMDEIADFASQFSEEDERKIVVDSLGGTAKILPELLRRLGHEVIDISEKTRPYTDPPNPKPEKLEKLKERVEDEDAYLGISNDLDADRVTAYHNERFLSGDEVFCILSQLVEGSVVASIDTTQGLKDLKEVEYTRVGDPFVMDKALEIDAELAGEPNGHYSFTDFVPYNSGILTALILSGLDLEEKLSKIPDYEVRRTSIPVEDKHKVIEALKENFSGDIISELDGVKFRYQDAEVLVRPSGSSPKVRVIAEAENKKEANKALNKTLDRINQF